MLSVIVYGRNDSHGYNLHKRAAISLNCIAEVLSDPDDELLFVDYNSPDDMPTFIEAIADTLTAAAKARLRTFRVRPSQHRRLALATPLAVVEPVARNVALRRSNPTNRWVLSTNTDMVFVPSAGQSLSEVAATADDGCYHLARFDVPEGLWEALDRKDAAANIAIMDGWGREFHLNEIVYGSADILYDGPGDFQMALRTDLFAIHGFNEEMVLGWHVDSNIARRMRLLRGELKTMLPHLSAFHCSHTRQATAYHRKERAQNDPVRFVDEVADPYLPAQAERWGCPDEPIEEIRLSRSVAARYRSALASVLQPTPKIYEAHYVASRFDDLAYEPAHVLPFLLDVLSCLPPGTCIGYVGARDDTFALLAAALAKLDSTIRLLTPRSAEWLAANSLEGGRLARSSGCVRL
jgi:hypothetical protein